MNSSEFLPEGDVIQFPPKKEPVKPTEMTWDEAFGPADYMKARQAGIKFYEKPMSMHEMQAEGTVITDDMAIRRLEKITGHRIPRLSDYDVYGKEIDRVGSGVGEPVFLSKVKGGDNSFLPDVFILTTTEHESFICSTYGARTYIRMWCILDE